MRSIQTLAGGVLAQIVRRQPPSPGRTQFAWQLAVGPVLARTTSVELEGGVLTVRATDPRWLKEIDRARAAILPKLQQLLGEDQVAKLRTRS
jgi:predicted nucleic acid-binding Zn ribbon protein